MAHTPTWKVISVFDPEGQTPGFSYTVGLSDRGHHELHMWLRPDQGQDPGADWAFSARDSTYLLNEFAAGLVDGTLNLAEQTVKEMDGGAASVTFVFGEPVEADTVEAFQVPTGALVIPIRWSLERAPEGELGPMTERAEQESRRRYDQLTAAIGNDLPAAFTPGQATFDPSAPMGPATVLVRARAAQVLSAEVEDLAAFVDLALGAERGLGARFVLAMSATTARAVGRSNALREVSRFANEVLEELTGGQDRPNAKWAEVLDVLDDAAVDPLERLQYVRAVHSCTGYALTALLHTEAVSDVAEPELLAAGFGPWAYALDGASSQAPGQLWHAPATVLEPLRVALSTYTVDQMRALEDAHTAFLGRSGPPAPVYWWCRAQATTAAAALPPLAEFLSDTPALERLNALLWSNDRSHRAVADGFIDALSMLVPALTQASEIDPDTRAAMVNAYGHLLGPVRDLLAGEGD